MNSPKAKNTKSCYVMLEPCTPKVKPSFALELKQVINERNMLTTKTKKRIVEALDEVEINNMENTRETQKNKIINEILESEQKYVNQLEKIITFFMKPTQEQKLLKSAEFNLLFGNVNTIYNINKELLQELGEGNVGKAFSDLAPFFKLYSVYACEFKQCLKFLQNCKVHHPKFAKFLENQESRPEVQSKLSALLIAPIQRIPRYTLLLKSLLKRTERSTEEYQLLSESVIKVSEAADHINNIIKDSENMQRLIELQRSFHNNQPNLIIPGRILKKEGTLMKISSKDGHSKKLHVVLMNDIIVFCKFKTDSKLKCSQIMPLQKCKMVDILDKGSFRLICQDDEIVLYHESLHETIEWIQDIRYAIETIIDDRKTLRKECSQRRPVKRKDINEYNDIGLSPGKPLKKKRLSYEEENWVKRRDEVIHGSQNSNTKNGCDAKNESAESSINYENASKELFVFGKSQCDRSVSFKIYNWVDNFGKSVKSLFGFKK